MLHVKGTLGALAVASSAAALVMAGGPALAGAHKASKSITGPEVISGAVHGKAALANTPTIPVTFRGLVFTHGVVHLSNSKSSTHTLKTPVGDFTVKGTGQQTSQGMNKKTCRVMFTRDITVKVLGSKSTGAFAGTSGPGAARVTFAAIEPRFKSGSRRGSAMAMPNRRRRAPQRRSWQALCLPSRSSEQAGAVSTAPAGRPAGDRDVFVVLAERVPVIACSPPHSAGVKPHRDLGALPLGDSE